MSNPLPRFRVHFHCGVDEVQELHAIDAAAAQREVEATFPKGQGWYVIKVEAVDPDANLEPFVEGNSDDFPFVGVGLI